MKSHFHNMLLASRLTRQHNISKARLARQHNRRDEALNEAFTLYGKRHPAQAGILVAETWMSARRDGTNNIPPPYKQYAIKITYTRRGFRASSRPGKRLAPPLIYKQAISYLCYYTISIYKFGRRCSHRFYPNFSTLVEIHSLRLMTTYN